MQKVPAIAYGGPKVSPDKPSPESQKLAESLVLIEFIADLSNSLRPKDPVLRAKARFFVEVFSTKFMPGWYAAVTQGGSPDAILTGIETIQGLLPPEGYAVGDWSIADAAVTPFLARAEIAIKNDLGAYDEGAGRKAYETLQADPKFARFRKYLADLKARKSFQETFDEARSYQVLTLTWTDDLYLPGIFTGLRQGSIRIAPSQTLGSQSLIEGRI